MITQTSRVVNESPLVKVSGVVGNTWVNRFTLHMGHKWYQVDLPKEVCDTRPERGEVWTILAEPYWDERGKTHYLAYRAEMVMPSGELLIDFLSRQFTGIKGPTARNLYTAASAAGINLYDAIDQGNVDALTQLLHPTQKRPILAPEHAKHVCDRWVEIRVQAATVKWMQNHNFSARLARKAWEYYQEDTIAALDDNPYRLLSFAPYRKIRPAFEKVDNLAREGFGIAETDERRLLAAFECALYAEYEQGNTGAELETLHERLNVLLGRQRPSDLEVLAVAAKEHSVGLNWDASDGGLLQLKGIHLWETYVADRFQRMCNQTEQYQASLFQHHLLPDMLASYEVAPGKPLNKGQERAVECILTNSLSVITGGAGVGKTTVLKAAYEQVLAQDGVIFQMALAGKAAKRMNQTTGLAAMTVAKFIYQTRKEAKKQGTRPSEVLPSNALYVLDEASMLDIATVYEILRIIPEGSRICFVGDPYQLPPIGAGLVFHVMARSNLIPRVELTEVQRQRAETGIPQAAMSIRQQEAPSNIKFIEWDHPDAGERYQIRSAKQLFPELTGVYFIKVSDSEMIPDVIARVYTELQNRPKYELGEKGEVQVLSGVNDDGMNGANDINHALQFGLELGTEALFELRDREDRVYYRLLEGEPVIFTQNQPERNLWNGSIGTITEIYQKRQPIMLSDNAEDTVDAWGEAIFDGEIKQLTMLDIAHLRLAYAITVHKSQGSQFERVIVLCQAWQNVDLTFFYTALTRAEHMAVFIGDWDVFKQRITQPPKVFNRVTGFRI